MTDGEWVTTEMQAIAQDEFREHATSVREACAEAAAQLIYFRELVARIAHNEKELRDELDALRGIVR